MNMHKLLLGAACLGYGCIALQAAICYPGSQLLYMLFTISATSMLFLSLKYYVGYSQIFLGIFLWLGLWLKLSIHLITGEEYVEATGGFKFDSTGYDELLSVATVAYFAVCITWILARILLKSGGVKIHPPLFSNNKAHAPHKLKAIYFVALLILLVNLINWNYGILKIGLNPQQLLPWPSSAIVSWLLGDGFPLIIAMLLVATVLRGRYFNIVLILVLFEAVLTSITTLSRGSVIWHAAPVFFAIFVNWGVFKKIIPRRVVAGFLIFGLASFAASFIAANFARDVQYAARQSHATVDFDGKEAVSQVAGLVLDRWLGAEGLMVAVGHTEKSMELLLHLIVEKNEIGKPQAYQAIADSIYTGVDLDIFQTGTIPGVIGFFYLGGSILVTAFGVFSLCMGVVLIERLIFYLTQNIFMTAHMGLWLANSVAQFGSNPRQMLFSLLINMVAIIIITTVQMRWFGFGGFSRIKFS
jgi:hypothetical protein